MLFSFEPQRSSQTVGRGAVLLSDVSNMPLLAFAPFALGALVLYQLFLQTTASSPT